MKIFSMNDCDWYVGESLEACKTSYLEVCEDVEDAYELTDEELDTTFFYDMDEDENMLGTKRTFREQLAIEIAEGGEFPRFFASTEY
jgi:hypothetical protein